MTSVDLVLTDHTQANTDFADISDKILLVDDEESILRAISKVLGTRYHVSTAISGNEALELIDREGPFAVVLSDMKMPCMDGIELLSRIREISPDTLRIILTGNADLSSTIDAINRGELFRFLVKPVPTDDLRHAIDDALKYYRIVQEYRINKETLRLENAAKDRFISILAHDLRNPLHEIIFSSEYLLQKSLLMTPERKTSMIDGIRRASRRISDLLENLLAWSRLQRGSMQVVPQSILLRNLLDNEVDVVRPMAIHKGIELTIDIDRDILIPVDPNILATVVRNLVTNAIKFTPAGGMVQILYESSEEGNLIHIVDDGPGIPPDKLQETLAKSLSTPGTGMEKGTGLGLPICAELMRLIGGRLEAESEAGKGAVFSIVLPREL